MLPSGSRFEGFPLEKAVSLDGIPEKFDLGSEWFVGSTFSLLESVGVCDECDV